MKRFNRTAAERLVRVPSPWGYLAAWLPSWVTNGTFSKSHWRV